jgi:hypothetical protein
VDGPSSRPDLGNRLSSRAGADLASPLGELADAAQDRPQLVPLQQEDLFCLTEAEALSPQPVDLTDLSPELIDLLCQRSEAAP